jgi:glycosyltransferase involved in cell wall biosynthesis
MKRIALVHWALPPVVGGVESYLVDLASGLIGRGYEVFVVSGQRAPTRALFPNVRLRYAPELDLDGTDDLHAGNYGREPTLARILKEIGPDIVHAHNLDHFDLGALTLLTAIGQRYNFKMCYTFHSLLGRPEARELLELWHMRLAVSDYVADAVKRRLGLTARVLHLPVDAKRFNAEVHAFSRPQFNILHPARIVPEKGVLRSLELVRYLLDRGINATLTLTSGAPTVDWKDRASGYLKEVLGVLQRLKLERNVLFRRVGYAEMPELYARSDLVVYPSEFDEPLGLVPLEAMASSRMIVASRRGGIPETIVDGETGVLFDSNGSDAFAAKVVAALNDLERTAAIAANGRRRILREFGLGMHIHSLAVAYAG